MVVARVVIDDMGCLVWDFDGTLGYREGGWSQACVDVLQAESEVTADLVDVRPHLSRGFPWHRPEEPHLDLDSADEWWRNLYPVFTEAFEANGIPAEEAAAVAKRVRQRYVTAGWSRFDDALPTLTRLTEDGWRHVILSNHVPELESILADLGLLEHFDEVYVSADIGYEKPNPNAFAPVTSTVDAGETAWMVGDNYRADVAGAEAVGLDAILVRETHPNATYSCETLSQVEGIIADG